MPGDQIEEASIVLLANEVDEVDDRSTTTGRRRRLVFARVGGSAALVLFVLIAAPLAQVLRWY